MKLEQGEGCFFFNQRKTTNVHFFYCHTFLFLVLMNICQSRQFLWVYNTSVVLVCFMRTIAFVLDLLMLLPFIMFGGNEECVVNAGYDSERFYSCS